MIKRKFFLLVLLGVAPMFSGCAFIIRDSFLKDESYRVKNVQLPFAISKILIEDKRESTSTKDLKVPVMAWPGRNEMAEPVISEEQTKLLQSEVASYFSVRPQKVIVQLQLLKGVKKYALKWSGERESSEVEIQVNLLDPQSRQLLFYSRGFSQMWLNSSIATKTSSENLYQKALKVALYKAMEMISPLVQ